VTAPLLRYLPVAAVLLAAACTTPIGSQGPGATHETPLGTVLVDANGMTLYTRDGDLPDRPACYDLCSLVWPFLEAAPGAQAHGDFSIVTRASGSRQWEYKRKPLYGYRLDSAPGDVGGDGVDGMWRVAKP
jgi:predicted lipoprotein with Yx(FWY)xxD motif